MTNLRPIHHRTIILVHRTRERARASLLDIALSRWRRRALAEVLISDLWQIWNDFVREMLLASCGGCFTRSGVPVPPRPGNNSWQRVSYEAKQIVQCRRQGKVVKIKRRAVNSHRFQDPTWGDLDYIVDLVAGLNPQNAATLTTAFGSTSRGLKDLQTVRNACFHKNDESRKAVKDAEKTYFSSATTRQPSDLAWNSYLGGTSPSFFDWTDAVVAVCSAAST